MTMHRISSEVFDLLADGDGDTLGVLWGGRRSKRLLLVHDLMSIAKARAPRTFADGDAVEAFAVLVEAQRRSRRTVEDLLLQPTIGVWATYCLRSLMSNNDICSADLGYLGAVAASAALRAGRAFEVTTYVRDGSVMFPTFGLARLGTRRGWCRVRSRSGGGGVEISVDGMTMAVPFEESAGAEATWLPLRSLRSSAAGVELRVWLDDLDPFRGCGQLRAAARLDATAVEDWQAKLDEAWSLLVRDHRSRAEAIAAGVTSIVPLLPTKEAPELSATCHEAIGAVAMTPPCNSLNLALALVHEFQHTKLWALLDLVPLVERSSNELFYAPWRPDPRPLQGLLHGAYAYLGLTGFWEEHRGRGGPRDAAGEDLAHFEFAMVRDQVTRALDALQRSGRLTPPGRRFINGMSRRLSHFRRVPVPPTPHTLARVACLDHATSWRLRNVRLDPDRVAGWADAWLAGQTRPRSGQIRVKVIDGRGPMPSNARLALFRHRLVFPTQRHEGIGDASAADILFLAGRLAQAADAYRCQLARAPDDLASWTGLVLVRRFLPTGATRALTTCPESVRALHQTIFTRTGAAPDAEELACWVADGAQGRRLAEGWRL
jgi:HEXXH motif-containing protein